MNNATHESSFHAIPAPDDSHPESSDPQGFRFREDVESASDVIHQLDQIRFNPRAATIRAIMKYAHNAHRKDEAVQ